MMRTPAEILAACKDGGELLHEDLQECVTEEEGLGPCLKHPLVYGVPYHSIMNALYNEQYAAKVKYAEEALAKKEWGGYVAIHERPYRFQAFMEVCSAVPDAEFWEIFGSLWTDTENQWQVKGIISHLLEAKRLHRENMMDEEERLLLSSLPDEFVVYRGHNSMNQLGFSWTLSYWRACYFARRFAKDTDDSLISKATVQKKDVVALFMRRREMEIAVHHKSLYNVRTMSPILRPPLVQETLNHAKSLFKLSGKRGWSSYHGPDHWYKVELNTIALCEHVPGADPLVCQLFAVLHDCKRENENHDPGHGHRAAKVAVELLSDKLTLHQMCLLVEACKWHNDGEVSDDPTIGVCWDADRLDLPRVNIIPDPALLSTDAARELIWKI